MTCFVAENAQALIPAGLSSGPPVLQDIEIITGQSKWSRKIEAAEGKGSACFTDCLAGLPDTLLYHPVAIGSSLVSRQLAHQQGESCAGFHSLDHSSNNSCRQKGEGH